MRIVEYQVATWLADKQQSETRLWKLFEWRGREEETVRNLYLDLELRLTKEGMVHKAA